MEKNPVERESKTSVEILELPLSLQKIIHLIRERGVVSPSQMRQIVLEAQVKKTDLLPWADFDHPVGDSYGRQLVYSEGNFEIMVMSWLPGDFSAIHDHGHTQWGCVQVFGPAGHATFRIEEGVMRTLMRTEMTPGDAIGVSHSLIHQMGNSTDEPYLSLHVYGTHNVSKGGITSDARLYDLSNNTIQRTDGGVFFALPKTAINKIESGPTGDLATRIRHQIELIRRLRRMDKKSREASGKDLQKLERDLFSMQHRETLITELGDHVNDSGHHTNSIYWRILNREMIQASRLQNELLEERRNQDAFQMYARLYDEVIGNPSLRDFMGAYLRFFLEHYDIEPREKTLISIGCGTGLIERYLIDQLEFPYDNVFGFDISEAMVQVASGRILAEAGDALDLDPKVRMWDIAYSGLNVFQYLNHVDLDRAIQAASGIVVSGGYFIGDFITPDHVRWYPNVMISEKRDVISLRTPELIEVNGHMYQQSEIVNINFMQDQMRVTYAGKHRRFLPPLHRVRSHFEHHFEQVDIYDAVTLDMMKKDADTCPSTRYVVIARK